MSNFDELINKMSMITIAYNKNQQCLNPIFVSSIVENRDTYVEVKGLSEFVEPGRSYEMEEKARDLNNKIDYHELEVRTCKACGGLYLAKTNESDPGVCQECFGKMVAAYNKENNREPVYHERQTNQNRHYTKKHSYNTYNSYNKRNWHRDRDRFEPKLDENGERIYRTFFMQLDKEEREFLETLSKSLHETKKKIVFDALRLYSETDEVKEKMGATTEL